MEENGLQPLLMAVESIRTVDPAIVPRNSLIREFIGGSSMRY